MKQLLNLKTATALLFSIIFSFLLSFNVSAQSVFGYRFTQSAGTFVPLTSPTQIGTNTDDDVSTAGIPIGFTFHFDGVDYTTCGTSSNGFVWFGSTVNATGTMYSVMNSTVQLEAAAAPFNDDLIGLGAGSSMNYKTTGSAGSRVFTAEWLNWGRFGGTEIYNFQVKLYEGTNKVDFIYGTMTGSATVRTDNVGLRGIVYNSGAASGYSTIFNSRCVINGIETWATSISSNTNLASALCQSTSTGGLVPATGLTFTYTPGSASALTGTKTIDNTGATAGNNYNNFTDAIRDLMSKGVGTGGVTFNVTTGQTFNELVPPIIGISGTASNQIVFQRSGGGANPLVQGTNGTITSFDACITLIGCDYITFNGIDVKDNPANATTTTQMENGYLVKNYTAIKGSNNNTIRNCTVTLIRTNTTTNGILQSAIATATLGGGIAPTSTTGANNSNRYLNFFIKNCNNGMQMQGNVTYPDQSCEVGGTTLNGATIGDGAVSADIGTAQPVANNHGLLAVNQSGCNIHDMLVQNVSNVAIGNLGAIGIYLNNSLLGTFNTQPCNIYNCEIQGINYTTAANGIGNVVGIRAEVSLFNTVNVYNNIMYNFSHTTTGANAAICVIGMMFGTAGNINAYYNSVSLNISFAGLTTACLYLNGGVLDYRNNALANLSAARTALSVARNFVFARNTGTINPTSSNNILFSTNLSAANLTYTGNYVGAGTTNRLNLYDWQTAPFTANPSTLNPYDMGTSIATTAFTSATVLTPLTTSSCLNSGRPIAGFTLDRTGATRNATTPDIGAYEDATNPLITDTHPPVISWNPPMNGTAASTFTITVTDNVNTTPVDARFCYRLAASGAAFTAVAPDVVPGTRNGNYTWNASLAGLTGCASYEYYIIIRDGATNNSQSIPVSLGTYTGLNTGASIYTANPTVINYTVNPQVGVGFRTFIKAAGFAGGSYSIGPNPPYAGGYTANYLSITAAVTAIACGDIQGNIIFELQSDYNGTNSGTGAETFPITFPQFSTSPVGSSFTITFRPKSGAPTLTTTGNPGSANALFNLNGADRYIFDGRPGGTGGTVGWIVRNTQVAATYGPVFRFINDATFNTLQYVQVESQNQGTLGAADAASIMFSTTTLPLGTAVGNSNNTIDHCNIRDRSDAAGTPITAIMNLGTTTDPTMFNQNNSITNNNIFNYFNSAATHVGLYLQGGTSYWTITGNSWYQTATRTMTVTGLINFGCIIATTGQSINFSNNYFGGTAPSCSGSALTYNDGGSNLQVGVYGFRIFTVGNQVASTVSGNTVTNINQTTGSPVAGSILFSGLSNEGSVSGFVNITGNTIGATSGTGSIVFTINGALAEAARGINIGGSTTGFPIGSCTNNNVGSISINGASTGASSSFFGINTAATINSAYTVSGNLVGSLSTANSIQVTAVNMPMTLIGMNILNASSTVTVQNNTVQNCYNASANTVAQTVGISVTGTAPCNILNNTVKNFKGDCIGNFVNTFVGIQRTTGVNINGPVIIRDNVIDNIGISNIAANQCIASGIYINSVSALLPCIVDRNKINNVTNSSTNYGAGTPGVASGILVFTPGLNGVVNVWNNMITLGEGITNGNQFDGIIVYNQATAFSLNAFNNTILIRGTNGTASTLTTYAFLRGNNVGTAPTCNVSLLNNIFINQRTGPGTHFAIANQVASAVGWPAGAANYNVLNAPDATAVGMWGAAFSYNGWQTASASDANSMTNTSITFASIGTSDLHISMGTTPTPIESGGISSNASIPNYDFDSQARPGCCGNTNGGGLGYDIGADEFNGVPITLDMGVSAILTPATPCDLTTTTVISITVKNFGLVTVNSGTVIPVSYTINGGGPVNENFTLGANLPQFGTANYTFTTTANLNATGTYSIVSSTNVIGDQVVSNNSFTKSITKFGSVVTVPGDFPSLTGIGGLFEAINNGGFSNNVLVNITADITETGIVGLNQWTECGGSGYTLTIKPTGAPRTLTGVYPGLCLFRINGADRVTIDGDLSGSRSLTFANTSPAGAITMGVFAPVPSNVCDLFTLKNCNIQGGSAASGIDFIADGPSVSGVGAAHTNLTLLNNSFEKAYQGVLLFGTSVAVPMVNTLVQNNIIGPSTMGASSIGFHGLQMWFHNNLTVTGNTIQNLTGTTAYGGYSNAILLVSYNTMTINNNTIHDVVCTNNNQNGIHIGGSGLFGAFTYIGGTIYNNKIYNVDPSGFSYTTSNSGKGIMLSDMAAATNPNLTIYNNVIYSVGGFGTVQGVSEIAGIYVGNNYTGVKLYHNSVNMIDNYSSATANCITAGLNIGTANTALDIRNNVLVDAMTNTGSGATPNSYAIYTLTASAGFTTISNNDYWSTGAQGHLGFLGANQNTLGAWQGAGVMPQDVNSQNTDPLFSSPSLLVPTSIPMNNSGTNAILAIVPQDILLVNRPGGGAATVDMGAYEFTPSPDLGITLLVAPSTVGCPISSANITFRVKNFFSQLHDFTANPSSIQYSVLGTNGNNIGTTTFNIPISTPNLAPGATTDFTVTSGYNMSGFGTYIFNATTITTGDLNASNDALTPATTINNVTPQALNYLADFNSTAELFLPSGWSADNSSVFQDFSVRVAGGIFGGAHGTTNSPGAGGRMSVGNTSSFLVSPKVSLLSVPCAKLFFDYRIVNTAGYPATATTIGVGDVITVQISTDCGSSFSTIMTIDNTNHFVTNNFVTKTIDLTPYVGQYIIIKYNTTWAAGDYYVDIDNFKVADGSLDAGILAITAPTTGNYCSSSSPIAVTVNVKNFGCIPISNVPVQYTVNGGSPTIETVAGPINAGATVSYTFTAGANIAAGGSFVIASKANLVNDIDVANDASPTNNTLTVTLTATANAGGNASSCASSPAYTLSGASATNNTSVSWATAGTGGFNNINLLNATYTPSALDISNGSVLLTLSAVGNSPCGTVQNSMTLTIVPSAIANAGGNASVCAFTAAYTLNGSSATNNTSVSWATGGTGNFNNNLLLHPTYTPSALDISNGSVLLTLTAYGNSPCGSVQNSMTLTINPNPAPPTPGSNSPVCTGAPLNLTALPNGMASYTWVGPSGFSSAAQNPTIASPTTANNGTYTLTVSNSFACTNFANTNVVVTPQSAPTATLSGGGNVCVGNTCQTLLVNFTGAWPLHFTYLANGANPVTISGLSGFSYTFTVCPSVSTTYTISNVGNATCSNVGTGTAVVSVNNSPVAGTASVTSPTVSSNAVVCIGNTVSLVLTGNNGNIDWQSTTTPSNVSSWVSTGTVTSNYNSGPLTQNTYYRAVVTTPGCYSVVSNTVTVLMSVTPTVTISNVTDHSMQVSWTPGSSSGAVYTVTIPGAPGSPFVGASNPLPVPGLTSGTLYNVSVAETTPGSCGTAAGASSATTSCTAPSAVSFTNITSTSASLSWTGAGPFILYYRNITNGLLFTQTVNIATNTYTLTGLQFSSVYAIYVTNVCGSFTPMAGPISYLTTGGTPCSIPSGLASTTLCSKQVSLSWNSAGGGITDYAVTYKRMLVPSGLTTVIVTGTNLIINTQPGQQYEIYVRSKCVSGTIISAPCVPILLTTPNLLAAPDNVVISSPTCNSFTIAWPPVAGAGGYVVEYERTVGGPFYNTSTTLTSMQLPNSASGVYSIRVAARENCTPSATIVIGNWYPDNNTGTQSTLLGSTLICRDGDEPGTISTTMPADMTVYPNPNAGQFVISFANNIDQEVTYSVTNILGQVVYTEVVNESAGEIKHAINLNTELSAGMYNVTVKSGDVNQTKNIILVKE